MTIAFVAPDRDLSPWFSAFQSHHPSINVIDGLNLLSLTSKSSTVSDFKMNNDVICAVVWKHPKGFLNRYPNLKLIISLGAGVDHIFADKQLNRQIPIVRIVDTLLTQDICEYILAIILNQNRNITNHQKLQRKHLWKSIAYRNLSSTHVGVLGVGKIGASVSKYLNGLGCKVSGWSRTKKEIVGIECYSGQEGLSSLVSSVDYLICLLPLTKSTSRLVDSKIFNQCKHGAYFINVGRGDLILEKDLISALDIGQLSGACLDTFCKEPLPKEHPFWERDDILITPHTAALTQPVNVMSQIVENYRRVIKGQALINLVDPMREY